MKLQGITILLLPTCFLFLINCKKPIEATLEKEIGRYFYETYEENRTDFIKISNEFTRSPYNGQLKHLPVESKNTPNLMIDSLYIPATDKSEKLILLTSGIHGIEAYASSAMQKYFLSEIVPIMDRKNTSVLIVHGINPWGFKHRRRVTENNVDLNRNFDVNEKLFQGKNDGYKKIYSLLNPEMPLNVNSVGNVFFPVRAVINIIRHSMRALRQAALQGQYEFEKGIYFGGKGFEQQRKLLEPVFLNALKSIKQVLIIDFHTGYGERGQLHLFPNAIKNSKIRKAIESVFLGEKIDYGDTGDFYTVTGDFTEYIGKIAPSECLYIPMVFEYGTLDSQTTMGSIRSIHNMILENQGFFFGYKSDADRSEIQLRFSEMFYPKSPEWRRTIFNRTKKLLPTTVKRFNELPLK